MPLTTEKTFHGLKLIARCGGGAYGEVYCCKDLSERRMAVKIVSKTRLGDAWKRELRGVVNYRRITENSPNLLQIFHVAEDEDHFYYTMEAADSVSETEYVPDTLAHRLQAGPLPPDQLFPVLAGICNGIAAIHQAGFAHRDIKPDNILFVGGVPKLADIGLVSSLSNSLTRLAGTLEFLPPEERGGDTPESTDCVSRQRNDLYAFGKVVYCAATGLEPGRYPSLPTGVKLSTELKLFMRLAFQLCARESRLRIGDLDVVRRELKHIERQLESGETPRDKVRYACGALARKICAGVLTLGGALRKTWWLLLLLALTAAAVGYRIHSIRQNAAATRSRSGEKPPAPPQTPPETQNAVKPPAPPVSPPPPTTGPAPKYKEYAVPSLDLKIRIPNRWQAMSEEYIRAQVEEMTRELNETKKDEEAKKMLRYAIEKAKTWKGLIRCDLYDVIEISRQVATAAQTERMWTLPEADLKREIMKQFGGMLDSAEIHEIRRTIFAGRRCVILDFSIDRRDRCREYMFPDDRGLVIVALTADSGTFARRAREFDEVMRTLEFTSPAPKYTLVEPSEPIKPPEPVKLPEPAKPTDKPKQAANPTSGDRHQRNVKNSHQKPERGRRTRSSGRSAKSKGVRKPLLEWMILDCPAYRKLAEDRKKELEERAALKKAGKFDISDDASRLEEDKLWRQVEDAYEQGKNSVVDTGFHILLRRIESIRRNRRKFEASVAASGKESGKKNVMTELAVDIGWENYKMLLESPRYEKLISEHEAEVAAEKERRKNGGPEPDPDSQEILEEKLWKSLKKAYTTEQILFILDHIRSVRDHRSKDKKDIPPPEESKKLIYEQLKFSLYIPKEWIIAFPDGRASSNAEDENFSPEQLNHSQKTSYDNISWTRKFEHWAGAQIVYCDKDKKWRDAIYICRYILNGGALYKATLEDNDRRTSFAGRCCVIEKNPREEMNSSDVRLLDLQVAIFYIDDGDHCITFTLYAKKETFDKRLQELETAMKTLKFTK